MNSKQTILFIISIVLCLAVYPFFDLSIAIMILLAACTGALTVMVSNRLIPIIPFLLSLAGALVFNTALGVTYMIPGMLTAVAALAGFVMGSSIKNKWALQGILLFSGGVFLLAIMGTIYGINQYKEIDSIKLFIEAIRIGAYQSISTIQQEYPTINPAELKSLIDMVCDNLAPLVPSILIITCATIAYVSFGVARYILKKNHIILPMIPDRRHLIMSRGSGWIMIIVWLLNMFAPNNRIGYALINISIIISALFFVCGVSLALHMIEYRVKNTSVKWILRVIMFTLIFSIGSSLITELFVMAAIIDSVWNFRKLGNMMHQ